MESETTVSVEVDRDAGAAYVHLSARPVARTVEHGEDLFVDLDDLGMVVGVEILNLNETVNLDDLSERYHIHPEALRVIASATR